MATYGTESWTLEKDVAKGLAIFEGNVLRKMFKMKWNDDDDDDDNDNNNNNNNLLMLNIQ